jgi:hypothetical protein
MQEKGMGVEKKGVENGKEEHEKYRQATNAICVQQLQVPNTCYTGKDDNSGSDFPLPHPRTST